MGRALVTPEADINPARSPCRSGKRDGAHSSRALIRHGGPPRPDDWQCAASEVYILSWVQTQAHSRGGCTGAVSDPGCSSGARSSRRGYLQCPGPKPSAQIRHGSSAHKARPAAGAAISVPAFAPAGKAPAWGRQGSRTARSAWAPLASLMPTRPEVSRVKRLASPTRPMSVLQTATSLTGRALPFETCPRERG